MQMLRGWIEAAAGDDIQRGDFDELKRPISAGNIHGWGRTGYECAICPSATSCSLKFCDGSDYCPATGRDFECDRINKSWVGGVQVIDDVGYRIPGDYICLITGGTVWYGICSSESISASCNSDDDEYGQ